MLKWDKDSPTTFKAAWIDQHGVRRPGRTVRDYDERFSLEDAGLIYPDDKIFRWSMLEDDLNYRLF